MLASFFPQELTALRTVGLVFAVLLIAFAIWRRHSLSNGAVLLGFFLKPNRFAYGEKFFTEEKTR